MRKFKDTSTILPTKIIQLWYKNIHIKDIRYIFVQKSIMQQLPIHFAPLQGYTEAFYRNAHAAVFGGIDTYYTPFVRIEKESFRNKDIREIDFANNHVPHLVPQLIAPSAEKAETILSLFIEKDMAKQTSIWDVLSLF